MNLTVPSVTSFLIAILLIIIVAKIIRLCQKMTYFRGTGIPFDSPLPLFGSMFPVVTRKRHLMKLVKDHYDRHPNAKYVGFFDFTNPVIIIRDPEIVKDITIKHFDSFTDHRDFITEEVDEFLGKSLINLKGNRWREARNVLSPTFTGSKMMIMFDLMSKCTENFMKCLEDLTEDDSSDINVKDAFSKYTTDVIATCAFGITTDSMKIPDNDFHTFGKMVLNFAGHRLLKLLFLTRVSSKLGKFFGVTLLDKKSVNVFKDIISNALETRKKEGITRPDMLQLMMEASEKLTIDEMVTQSIMFFVGGYETTSNLMSFVALELAANPVAQRDLQEEIDQVLKENKGNLTYEIVNSMRYLEAVLSETLRLYPATLIDRVCTKDFELPPALPGLEPFLVKRGVNLWAAILGIHRDSQYYPEPDKFDPSRFLNHKINISQPTFLSFGIGPRSCIGNRFALMENKIFLFHLLANFNLTPSEKVKVPHELSDNSFTLAPVGGFWLKLRSRKSNKTEAE